MSAKSLAYLVGLLVFVSLGCGSRVIVVNGIEVYEKIWNKTVADLQTRASYEMQCPAEALQFLLLRREGRHPSQVAINGCDKRALYVRTVLPMAASQWVLSSASWTEPAPPPAAPPAPAPATPAPAPAVPATGVSI